MQISRSIVKGQKSNN